MAAFKANFVIQLARLLRLLIQQTLVRSPRLQPQQKAIILIINCFSLVVLSLTRHSQSNSKSIQIIIGIFKRLRRAIIILIILLIVIAILTLQAITQISKVRILLVICLYLIEDQYKILPQIIKQLLLLLLLPVIILLPKIITYSICKLISLLFINKALINVKSFILFILRGIQVSPLLTFYFCYIIRLFNLDISSFNRVVVYTAVVKLNNAYSQQIVIIQAPQVYY